MKEKPSAPALRASRHDWTRSARRVPTVARALACLVRVRFGRATPAFISHLLTARCFARCPTCLWRGDAPEERSTATILDFYRRARAAGFVSANFWGGEPLLRDDVAEILRGCRDLGFVTSMVTNGYLLPARAGEIAPWLHHLVVSMDLPDEKHDALRGVPGLFLRALAGIDAARARNPRLKILLNAVVSRHSYPEVLEVASLAARLGITVSFEVPDEGRPRFRADAGEIRCRLAPELERAAFAEIARRKAAGQPINNSRTYLRLFAEGAPRYRCHLPRLCLRVAPDGTAGNCLHPAEPLGNVYADPLERVLAGPAARSLYAECVSCSRCTDCTAIETSLVWERPEVLVNSVRRLIAS